MATSEQDYHEQTAHHVIPPRVYVTVFALLLIFTALTVFIATVELGAWNIPVALLIATIKASLVFLFFMGVRWYAPMLKTIAAAGFIWFGIMVMFTLSDFVTRDWAGNNARVLGPAPVGQDAFEVPAAPTAGPELATAPPNATPIGTSAPTGDPTNTSSTPGANPGDTDSGR